MRKGSGINKAICKDLGIHFTPIWKSQRYVSQSTGVEDQAPADTPISTIDEDFSKTLTLKLRILVILITILNVSSLH